MRLPYFLLIPLLSVALQAHATDTLTVEQCQALAIQNSPLQQKKLYAESIAALQTLNIRSNNLPRIQVGAQATWQSDVFGLPINSPLFEVPQVPKDQYKLSVDVAERIWDGGSDRYLRRQRSLENELAAAQVDVDVYQLREVVTDLYFKSLLLQESNAVLQTSKEDLGRKLKQAEAAIAEGAALRTSADQIRLQILKTEQQVVGIQTDIYALRQILARWIGRENGDFALVLPPLSGVSTAFDQRPEFKLLDLQQRSFQLQKDRLHLLHQPRVEAFAQGGLGRPNPFNFFETDFQPFLLIGLRASWTPFDWGNRSRDAQVLDLQVKTVDTQRAALLQRLEIGSLKDKWDTDVKYRQQLAQDDEIIRLQEDIIRRSDAQVQNGVMTMTDYLSQIDLLTQARLNRKTHLIQAVQVQEMSKVRK
ncbi:MAG: TolC family protein [Bacteroidetes bacterium]|nr:TolC family protein [Bacteroidota bacterium]